MNLAFVLFQNVAPGTFFIWAGKNCVKLDPSTAQMAVDLGTGTFPNGLTNSTLVAADPTATIQL